MTWVTLRRDIPTTRGTYVKGTPVKIPPQIASPPSNQVVICLDPPGKHLAACHNLRIPKDWLDLRPP